MCCAKVMQPKQQCWRLGSKNHEEFSKRIWSSLDCAQTWGRLAGFNEQNLIDKQIAAIAIVYDLTLVTH